MELSRLRAGRGQGGSQDRLGQFGFLVVLLTFTPSIAGVSLQFGSSAGGGSLYVTDLLLPVATLLALRHLTRDRALWVPFVLVSVVVLESLVGLYHGASIRYIVRDARGPAYIACTAVQGIYLRRQQASWGRRGLELACYLALIALLELASQFGSLSLVGSSQNDVLYYGGTAIQLASKRAQIGTYWPALCVLAGVVGAYVAGCDLTRAFQRRWLMIAVGSSVVILFVAYSRNTFLGLGGGILCGLVAPVGRGGVLAIREKVRGMTRAAVNGTGIAVLVAIPAIALASAGVASNQIADYDARVVNGLSSKVLATDDSVLWRDTEDHLALKSIADHLWVGVGLGTFYRVHVPGEPFIGDQGRIYVHDYYLGALVKGGLVGGAILLVVIAGGLARLFTMRGSSTRENAVLGCAACGLVGALAVAVFAPWPAQNDGSALLGLLLGAAWASGMPIYRTGILVAPAQERVGDSAAL